MLKLTNEIGRGRNKICYEHPLDQNLIVKINTKESMRVPKRLILLSLGRITRSAIEYEYLRYNDLINRYGSAILEIMPKCHGFVETNLGKGLVYERVNDGCGSISQSIPDYIANKQNNVPSELTEAFENFKRFIVQNNIVLGNSGAQNYFINIRDGAWKVVIIDIEDLDLAKQLFPIKRYFFRKRLVNQKLESLEKRSFERHA